MAQIRRKNSPPDYRNILNQFLQVAIEQNYLPSYYNQLLGNNTDYPLWEACFKRAKEENYPFSKSSLNNNMFFYLPQFRMSRGVTVKMHREKAIYSKLIPFLGSLPHIQNLLRYITPQRGNVEIGRALHNAVIYLFKTNRLGFSQQESDFARKNISYIFAGSSNQNFLGVCLGGKKCKQRKKLRQDNRKDRKENRIERRNILTEKKREKVIGLKTENEANQATTQLLNQFAQPQQTQQEQAQSRQTQVEPQNALPPNPQNNPPKKEDNTLLWIGGGVGTLIVLGLIAFLLLKK